MKNKNERWVVVYDGSMSSVERITRDGSDDAEWADGITFDKAKRELRNFFRGERDAYIIALRLLKKQTRS